MKILYIVIKNATTSVPLEAAGKIQEMAKQAGIEFLAASYYAQSNPALKASFVENLIQLNFKYSFSPLTLIKYFKLIKKNAPDVLHLHHGVSAFQGAILAKLAGIKTIIKTEHNDHRHYKWYQKILTVPVFFLCDRIICNSHNTLLSFYPWEKALAGKKSSFIYNGINTAHIHKFGGIENNERVRKKFKITQHEKLFVSVGRLIPQKNCENLIKAFIEVAKTNTNVRLLLAGGGPLHEKLLELIRRHNMESRVQLLGMI